MFLYPDYPDTRVLARWVTIHLHRMLLHDLICKRCYKRDFLCASIWRVYLTLTPGVQSDRRAALVSLAAIPAVLAAKPAEAAYGDSANVFGRATNTSGAF